MRGGVFGRVTYNPRGRTMIYSRASSSERSKLRGGSASSTGFGPYLETIQAEPRGTEPTTDLQSKLLLFLMEHTSSDIAELVRHVGAPLADILKALRELQEFRLVQSADAAGERWEPTPSGIKTAQALL